jgi:small subunit ribosomal protein S8
MSMSDPLADMLTRIRNASKAHFSSVEMPLSNIKISIANVLKEEGYIADFYIIKTATQGILKITFKYGTDNERVLNGIRRVSKPGYRQYKASNKIQKVMSGLGVGIITTSHGVMTDKKARQQNIGGELLCEVW